MLIKAAYIEAMLGLARGMFTSSLEFHFHRRFLQTQ